MRSMEWIQLTGVILHGNIYLWLVAKKSSVSCTQRFTYFQILYYALERWTRTHNQILSGRTTWRGSKVHQNTELWTKLMVSQWNSSGIFPRIHHIAALQQSPRVPVKNERRTRRFTGRVIFMSMFNDISLGSAEHKQECESSAKLVSIYAIWFSPGKWSFLGPGSEKKWYSTFECKPQGEWDRVAELIMLKFAESGHPVFRATSAVSRGTLKSKGGGKLSIHFCADQGTIETVFRTISVNQLSIYGAVAEMCEECKTCHVGTGRPVLAGQSDPLFVPSVMKTHTLLTDDLAQEEDLLQRYQERVERLSQQNRVIEICTDAGFLTTVEVGRYFMTKDTEEFSQFTEPVACREYTLPRDEKSSDPKGWIRGNTKIGTVLEVTTSYLQGKYWVEIRIESVNKDNSHSWVRISHGLNKLVTELSDNKENDNNEQETSSMQVEEIALKTNACCLKQKHKDVFLPVIHKNCTDWERIWTDIEPQDYSSIDYPVSKQLSTLLRHGNLLREDDGAIEFWRLKDYLRNHFEQSQHGSDEKWKSTTAKGGRNKKRFQYCTDPSGQEILYLRSLQGHSGRNLIDPSLQDNVFIPNDFFEYIYHIGCAINLRSITDSGLIPGGQNSSRERQTVFFTAVNPMNKDHKDPYEIDLEAPRLAWCKQKKWRRHQDTVYWVDIQLAQQKRLKFYQTRSNAIIHYNTLPPYCIPKVIMMESGEIMYEKVYASPRSPPKISFKDNRMKELDSEVAGSSKDVQRIQPKSKNQLSRTGRTVSEQPSGTDF